MMFRCRWASHHTYPLMSPNSAQTADYSVFLDEVEAASPKINSAPNTPTLAITLILPRKSGHPDWSHEAPQG
jgi:hypothetical protein